MSTPAPTIAPRGPADIGYNGTRRMDHTKLYIWRNTAFYVMIILTLLAAATGFTSFTWLKTIFSAAAGMAGLAWFGMWLHKKLLMSQDEIDHNEDVKTYERQARQMGLK